VQLWSVVAASALWLGACGAFEDHSRDHATEPHRPQHLVLISLDTTRADRLTPYGYELATAPSLAVLAQRGVTFEAAVSQSISTPPSHASILTGINPPRHGLRKLTGEALSEDSLTLAEILSAEGFDTAAFVSGVPLRREMGLDQGFDLYDDLIDPQRGERSAPETNAAVEKWLPARGERVFLWVHFFDPHAPYLPPQEYRQRFVGRHVEDAEHAFGRNANTRTNHSGRGPDFSASYIELMKQLYDADVRGMDDGIGGLLAMLEAAGILEHAIVAVIADHGESLGEHDYYFGHWDVRWENAQVPFILVHPQGQLGEANLRGRRIASIVRTTDLVPTVLSWLGLPIPADLDGRDLTPLLRGSETDPREAYTEQVDSFPFYALRTREWLFLERHERTAEGRRPRQRLFRRQGRSESLEDVADRHPSVCQHLAKRVDELRGPAVQFEHVRDSIPKGVEDQLRAIGYISED
jgi:arylsulfatase A-like enzyme